MVNKYELKGRHNFDRRCEKCGAEFKGAWNQKYCFNPKCRKIHSHWKESLMKNIPTGTVGTIQELKVSVDLLGKGFQVFRALSPSSFCDLLIYKDGNFFDLEVRTAHKYPGTGKLCFPKKSIKGKYLALVIDNEIIYQPDFLRTGRRGEG